MTGSSAPLRRLGMELRRLRMATGRTQADVGKAIGRTHATLVNWEHGKTKISKSDLLCLMTELGVPNDVRAGLEQLRDESGPGAGQWAVYGLPDSLKPLISFEADAVAVTAFEPIIIPGLLQTEDYARAIHIAGPHTVAPENVEKWVAARIQRQRQLTGAAPLKFHAVISEAALRLQVGGSSVMTTQIEHLLESSRLDNITIQILPAAAGAHPALAGNFTILHFADPTSDPPLGYFDGPLGGYMISDEAQVAAMADMFDDICAKAATEAESTRMLTTALRDARK
ncbi:helix-turn-helix transcriptional regulator [Sphaerisporangium sp. NPDC051011]|uniref:helix-turn-helix domain-containing protein n=1 Tax=Sphaerisporangium sp. NPDC051011 TaxID=3155792 RepID=UPI0033F91DAA